MSDSEALLLDDDDLVDFLLGGGKVTMAEWVTMGPELREGLARAGLRIRKDQAARIGFAMQGPMAAARVAGGTVWRSVRLAQAVSEIAKGASHGR